MSHQQRATPSGTNGAGLPWRKEGIVHKNNEAFLDILEHINMTISATGQVLEGEIMGRIAMNSALSGMPHCVLPLRSTLPADEQQLTFHECVEVADFIADDRLHFVPPDGKCVLLEYRIMKNLSPPMQLIELSVKRLSPSRLQVCFALNTNVPAQDTIVKIPCPSTTTTVTALAPVGKVKFVSKEATIVWTVPKLETLALHKFTAEVVLSTPSSDPSWIPSPVSIAFKANAPASGVRIVNFGITEGQLGYHAARFVRYSTTTGQYKCNA